MDVQITVASKVPAAEGKKTSKVIDSTGKTWHVYNDKFPQFQEGCSYLITKYKINDFRGTSYYMVETFTPVAGGAQVASNGGYTKAVFPPTNPPRLQSSPDNSKIDEQRRMDIFICGAFNNMMANPNVHPLELTISQKAAQVNELRQIWLNTLGPNRPSPISTSTARMENAPPPAHNADLDDQIPF